MSHQVDTCPAAVLFYFFYFVLWLVCRYFVIYRYFLFDFDYIPLSSPHRDMVIDLNVLRLNFRTGD